MGTKLYNHALAVIVGAVNFICFVFQLKYHFVLEYETIVEITEE